MIATWWTWTETYIIAHLVLRAYPFSTERLNGSVFWVFGNDELFGQNDVLVKFCPQYRPQSPTDLRGDPAQGTNKLLWCGFWFTGRRPNLKRQMPSKQVKVLPFLQALLHVYLCFYSRSKSGGSKLRVLHWNQRQPFLQHWSADKSHTSEHMLGCFITVKNSCKIIWKGAMVVHQYEAAQCGCCLFH